MKRIPLTQGKFAVVDDEYYNELKQYKWYPHKTQGLCYAVRHTKCIKGKRGLIYMHRQILKAPKGKMTDHFDRNGLNNRIYNIRLCTNSQNQANSKNQTNNTSGCKGVSWHKHRKKWISRIRFNGILKHIGYYNNKLMAAQVYDDKAVELFGEFAHLNFPVTPPDPELRS